MSDDLYVQVIREIEAEKGRITAHEQVCAERYGQINRQLTQMQTAVDKVAAALTRGDGKLDKWKDRVMTTIIVVLFGFASWAALQLYQAMQHGPVSVAVAAKG